jgi:hypothetical protein
MLDKFKADLYVFDDLERCEMPISKTLGYINEFVEHDGYKVVIVANEAEITDSDEYLRRREKLIGKVLEVQSAFGEALAFFTSLVDYPPTKLLFDAKAAEISLIYHQSGLNNLRVLQQTMWDFERVHRALSDEHRQNGNAMTNLLQLIFALSFEVKVGRLQAGDLVKRANRIAIMMMERHEPAKPTAFVIAHKRYGEIDLGDTLLSDEVVIGILVKGIIDEHAIRTALNRSTYFATSADEPAWITVWKLFERTDEEFNAAYLRMEQQFAERKFIAVAEILQVFGLRLWLTSVGVLRKGRSDVALECKQYVNDLYDSGRLEAMSRDHLEGLRPFIGWGGYEIHESETEDFKELYAYLRV